MAKSIPPLWKERSTFFKKRLLSHPLGLVVGWMLLWAGLTCCAPEGKIELKVVPTFGQKFTDAQRMTFEMKGDGLEKSPIKEEFDFSDKKASVPAFAIKQDTDKPWFDMSTKIFDKDNKLIALGQARVPFVSKTFGLGILISRVNTFGWVTELSNGSQTLMPGPLVGHQAVTLPDGRILIVGGATKVRGNQGVYEITQPNFLQKNLMLYNPKTGLVEISSKSLQNPRAFHTATLMANGLVVIAGGMGFIDNKLTVLKTVEIYRPRDDALFAGLLMKEPRAFHTATRVGDSEIVMVGGLFKPLTLGKRTLEQGYQVLKIENYTVGDSSATSVESGALLYPATQSGCGPFPAGDKITEVDGRWLHQTSLLTDSLLLVTGGLRVDKDGKRDVPKHAILLQRNGSCWRPKKVEKDNVYARYEHTSTVIKVEDRRWVVVAGGRNVNNQVVGPIEIWSESGPVANPGQLDKARFGHKAIALPNQQILFVGGMGKDLNFEARSEYYRLELSSGAQLQPISVRSPEVLDLKEPQGRFYGVAALSPLSPRVVIFGGASRNKVTDPDKQKEYVWTFSGSSSAEFFTYIPSVKSN